MLAFASETIALMVAIVVIYIVGILALLVKCYRMPSQGQALVRSGYGGTKVSFDAKIVIPIIHKLEWLDITLKRLVIDRQGNEALTCKDGTRADIKAAFFIRINPAVEDVKKVVQKLGIEGAADIEKLSELFVPRFLESLQAVAKVNTFEQLSDREYVKQQVMQAVGHDLDGYTLDVVTIDYLEKTQTV